ncbi:MAG TPA: ABC transporter permease subunit [Steroidobacteraceae bacterium]|nr:ABC transporter permease subunit [Steroidobacteraceae bacterium]
MSGGLWRDALAELRRDRLGLACAAMLLLLAAAAAAGPLLLDYRPDQIDWENVAAPPLEAAGHWLGTDRLGRDMLVRTLHGLRVSLAIALAATLVALVIGVTWGAFAGYRRGRVDALMMRLVDVLYSLPQVFFVIILTVVFGRSPLTILVAIGAFGWLTMARIVRGQALAIREREFVDAAVVGGAGTARIVARHVVPNLLGPVIVYATLTLPQVILVESFLSFLGIGIQEPLASLGNLIADGAAEMETAPWILAVPAACLMLLVFCFNFLGDSLRDALDPRDR